MRIPEPKVGLVIGYAYLWREEHAAGRDHGRKDRPCIIILVSRRNGDQDLVTVAPITHTRPSRPDEAVEIPAATKRRLGLDEARSWIVASELNQFVWPGPDLRPTSRSGETVAWGYLPGSLVGTLKAKILDLARSGRRLTVRRPE